MVVVCETVGKRARFLIFDVGEITKFLWTLFFCGRNLLSEFRRIGNFVDCCRTWTANTDTWGRSVGDGESGLGPLGAHACLFCGIR